MRHVRKKNESQNTWSRDLQLVNNLLRLLNSSETFLKGLSINHHKSLEIVSTRRFLFLVITVVLPFWHYWQLFGLNSVQYHQAIFRSRSHPIREKMWPRRSKIHKQDQRAHNFQLGKVQVFQVGFLFPYNWIVIPTVTSLQLTASLPLTNGWLGFDDSCPFWGPSLFFRANLLLVLGRVVVLLIPLPCLEAVRVHIAEVMSASVDTDERRPAFPRRGIPWIPAINPWIPRLFDTTRLEKRSHT